MEQGLDLYKLKPHYARMIVDAIVDGYRDYIEIRKKYRSLMAISSGFAWTKSNFIEHKVVERCQSLGFRYKKARAGLTWDYLQFIHEQDRMMFVIKDAAYFLPAGSAQSRLPNPIMQASSQRTYLNDLARLNQHILFPDEAREPEFVFDEELTQGAFDFGLGQDFGAVPEDVYMAVNEFHILTYALDSRHQMSEIIHYMPSPSDHRTYEIEDLSSLIQGAELSEEERKVFAADEGEYMRVIAEHDALMDAKYRSDGE